jgi:hypothetical protein
MHLDIIVVDEMASDREHFKRSVEDGYVLSFIDGPFVRGVMLWDPAPVKAAYV